MHSNYMTRSIRDTTRSIRALSVVFLAGLIALAFAACDDNPVSTGEEPIDVTVEGIVVDATGNEALLEKSGPPREASGLSSGEQPETSEQSEKLPEDPSETPGDVQASEGDEAPVREGAAAEQGGERPLAEEGDPINGAEVTVYRPGETDPLATATTSADGSYELEFTVTESEVPPELELQAEAQYFTTYTATVDFEASITYDVALEELGPDAPEISGTVTDFNSRR